MRTRPSILVAVLAVCLMGNGTPVTSDPEIDVHVLYFDSEDASRIVHYDKHQLSAMASTTLESLRGTQQKPAIPLLTILFKDTGVKLADVRAVVIVVTGMPPVLRGEDLEQLDKLVLASGKDKGAFGHPWSLAPTSIASWQALRARIGSRRKHGVSRIDIHLRKDIPVPAAIDSSP